MAPTTAFGRHHEIIDKDIQNRESSKIGKLQNTEDSKNLTMKLNDLRHHKNI
jgi:hypothetical protein